VGGGGGGGAPSEPVVSCSPLRSAHRSRTQCKNKSAFLKFFIFLPPWQSEEKRFYTSSNYFFQSLYCMYVGEISVVQLT
jgi:hypothetical protein